MDWKIIAALAVAVAIVVSGFFASGGVGGMPSIAPRAGSDILGNIVSGVKGAVSNILSGVPAEKNINRTLQVSGSLEMQDGALSLNSPADLVAVRFGAPVSFAVGGETASLEGAVSLENFTGRIGAYRNKTVYIDGNAEKVIANGVGISSGGGKTVPVKIAASANSVRIYNITIGKLSLNASGSVSVGQEKAALKIESEMLEIDGFLGNLEIGGASINLNGLSTKVLLNGREKVSVG